MKNEIQDGTNAQQSTAAEVPTSSPNTAKPNVIRRFFSRISNAFKVWYWVLKNPQTMQASNFKMLSDLFGLIMKVAIEDRAMMTHIAYVHPEEGEKQIVSIWAGAGMGAEPTKRITELLDENRKLKMQLSKAINNENI
jgi:hypothetical protein